MSYRKLSFSRTALVALGFSWLVSTGWGANLTWSGNGADNNWSTGANWGGAAPVNGDNLTFGGALRQNNSNTLLNLTNGWVRFNNGDFTLGGNALALNPGGSGVFTNVGGVNTVGVDLVLIPAAKYWSVAAGSELRLAGVLTNTANTGTSSGWLGLTGGGTVRLLNAARSTRGMDLFSGTVMVDGGLVDANNDGIRFKPATGATAAVVLTNNGTMRIGGGGNVRLGHNGTVFGPAAGPGSLSVVTVSSGTLELYGPAVSVLVGDVVAGATGVFNQNGGLVWGSAGSGNVVSLGNVANADGTYNLNGGTLWIAQVKQGSPSATNVVFNFNGGTLKPTASSTAFFQGLLSARVQNSGAVIDTTNFDITIAQNLQAGGTGGLTKLGLGTLTLSGANTYTGSTVVSNGTLSIIGSLLGGGGVTVYGGQLSGTGTIGGAVAVQPGGTLSPGGSVGTLTVQGNLSVAGNLLLEVDKSQALTNDFVQVGGTVGATRSATVTITNLGPAYQVGDSFRFFSGPVAGGGTLTFSPAAPGVGLAWSNNLAVDGSVSIISAPIVGTPADLVGLSLSVGTLSPAFSSNLLSYTASVAYSNSAVSVTAVSANSSAMIRVSCGGVTNVVASGVASGLLPLKTGVNFLDVSVTAPDGSLTKDYVVNLTRTPPNVVLILADDQGFSDWSCYGSEIATPNLDKLASAGLRFRNFYNEARCSPTRCSILTGLYTQQVAVDPSQALPNLRNDNNATGAELLQANGFRTYMVGKWHLGNGALLPEARGFQQVWRYADGNAHNEDTWNTNLYTLISSNNEITNRIYAPGTFYQPDAIGDYSLDFLENHFGKQDDKPFFLYMAFGSAHFPIQAPKALVDNNVPLYSAGWDAVRNQRYANMLAQGVIFPNYALSPNEGTAPWSTVPAEAIPAWSDLDSARQADLTRRMAIYAAMVQKMDANIGRLVQRLQQQGQLENTLIIALSDNGGNFEGGVYGLTGSTSDAAPLTGTALTNMGLSGQPTIYLGGGWAHVSNTPFRLFKHFVHNGGSRTPCIIHWPQGLTRTNQWEEQPGHVIDIVPTILDVAGVTQPAQFNGHAILPMEGQSLQPLFTNNEAGVSRVLGFEHESNRAWISGTWKLVTKNYDLYTGTSPANELELYDLSKDPSETTNLAYTQLSVLGQMVTNWNAWAAHVGVPSSRYLTSLSNAVAPVQLSPAPGPNDLFLDTFNRPDNTNIDASAIGMSGSRVPPLGLNAAYYEGYEGSGLPTSIEIVSNSLRMAVGQGMAECGLMHNFIGQDILDAGGFSIELNVQAINTDPSDATNRYVGFGVGLTQAQAATGGDIANPLPSGAVAFRGEAGGNTGATAFFVELDLNGNVKVWSHGTLLDSVSVGQNTGVLTAAFNCTGFTTNDTVTVTVFFNGHLVDINTADPNSVTRTFHWNADNSNYIGLSARASNYAQMDNLAIRKLPLVSGLVTDYALSYGLTGTNSSPTADPDGDGVSNLGEWAFGGDPSAPDAYIAGFKGIQVLPGNDFRFQFQRYRDFALVGLRYRYFISEDLSHWTETTPVVLNASSNEDRPDYEVVTLGLPGSVTASKNQLFLRILADTAN